MGLKMLKDGSNVIEFKGHIERVIEKLDKLYEFGPTSLFMFASGMDEVGVCAMFNDAMDDLTVTDISRGLARIECLSNRKRVCPWPTEFAQICMADDADWHDLKGCFEQRIA